MPNTNADAMRWRQSLVVRIAALCGILILCLFVLVYLLSEQYHQQVIRTMNAQAQQVIEGYQVWIDTNPAAESIERVDEIDIPLEDGVELDIVEEYEATGQFTEVPGRAGYIYTTVLKLREDDFLKITALLNYNPPTEVIKAFTNRYLLMLAAAFFSTLGIMLYLIARNLQPLRELSKSCADISRGNLREVSTRGTSSEIRALEQTFNRMVADLREKERVEANLRQAQRLSAIGNLAAGVAHDIRNPLNSIKLLSGNVLDELAASPDGVTAVHQVQTIRNEVNRLEDIVSSFLSLAREEELDRQPGSVDPIAQACVNLLAKEAEDRGVQMTAELRAGHCESLIDGKKLKRAVLNVMINALEACPRGGRVRIFTRVAADACEIEIRDDGPGIPENVLERAFDPYYTTKSTGTGLGLSLTRGIVEEHGGTVSISSAPGRGSQVLIRLPLETAAPV